MTLNPLSVTSLVLATALSVAALAQSPTTTAKAVTGDNEGIQTIVVPPSAPETDPQLATVALQFFLEQAQSGSDYAQLSLGESYLEGIVVPVNLIQAYAWLSLARQQGLTEAQPLIDRAWAAMTPDERTAALAVSIDYQKWMSH